MCQILFSYEFSEIFKNTYFEEHLQMVAFLLHEPISEHHLKA